VGISYQADTELARKTVMEAIRNVPGFVAEPAPTVGFSNFGDPAMELKSYFWIDARMTDPASAKDSAFSLVKAALDGQGIEIPLSAKMLNAGQQRE
jgi:small-conductance mechanosensitive channel